jgi:hypothetical protein
VNCTPLQGLVLDFRNEVGRRDINKVTGSKGQEKRDIEGQAKTIGKQSPRQKGKGREEILQERLFSFPSAVNEYAEVPQLLRDLVGHRGKPGADTHLDVDRKKAPATANPPTRL